VKMPLREHSDLLSFLQEPRMLNRVRSPHIVALRDIERVQDALCLVMEYVPGGSLRDRMGAFGRGNALPEAFAVLVARGVLRALAAAHALGVLHRDIKPDNVLLTEDGHVKVTDFGIARIVEATGGVDLTMQPGGTMIYMSPEALRGEVSRASDLWATSAMLYEMLCGRLPFPGPSTAEIVNQIFTMEPRPLGEIRPGIDAALDELVLRGLAKDPRRRYKDADELEAGLAAVEARFSAAVAAQAPPSPRSDAAAVGSGHETERMIDVVVANAPEAELPALAARAKQLILNNPADPLYHRALAHALRRMGSGNEAEAFDEYERAFLLDRTDRAAAEGLADLGLRLRRPLRTKEALVALSEIEPQNASFHDRLAMACKQNGERTRAIAHMKRALELEPGHSRRMRFLEKWVREEAEG
jgi:tRNA A-37 threonylcarbamoyl transferase component Bud32